ncbi:protocadherin delta 1, partial [Chelydra serpentina]
VPETLSDFNELSLNPELSSSTLTLYLIVSLGSVSFTFLVAIIILTAIKCHKDRHSLPSCCCVRAGASSDIFKNSNIKPQLSSGNKVPTNCLDVAGSGPPGYCYKVCLTPESAKSDFMFLKPYSPSPPRNNEKAAKNLPGSGRKPRAANNTVSAASQLKQANTDCLPTKTQRSALKSSQSLEDIGGVRRGVQKEHDQLRTLVTPVSELQKASGASNSIWTPRYGPLYPPHIPPLDYQHNVYIPGTPTMLANKEGPRCLDPEDKNSFSTFGKRK